MSDWIDDLDPDERERWDAFVTHFRRDALEKISDSTAFVAIAPTELDVKFCVELGAAIMLDKPLLVIAMEGAEVPSQLRKISVVVHADLDTEAGRLAIESAIRTLGQA